MRYLFHLFVILAAGCLTDTVTYSPQQDDDAINALVYQFSAPGPGGLTVALCEDVAAVEDTNNCQVQHTVRGGGRGKRHEEEQGGVGCGGCPFATVAYVTATVSGGSLTTPQRARGEVTLGYGAGDEPYGFPYRVQLTCEGTPTPCSVSGLLEEDGSFQITFSDNMSASNTVEVTLARGGEASCP